MKLITTKSNISVAKDYPGLFACQFEHKVEASGAVFDWTGPRISLEVWQQVLSFFKWTYDSTKSESQVRLYLHPQLGWRAWAFPQRAGTGMSAHELSLSELKVEETPEQTAERFGVWGTHPSGDWLRFGSVHHHCACSAFQSGTDRTNEEHQDGLHITVGKMDEAQHDLHCRFYLNGFCFEPDMDLFWDIGEPWASAPAQYVRKDAIARAQMGAPSSLAFPAQWRDNFIEVKRVVETPGFFGPGQWQGNGTGGAGASSTRISSDFVPLTRRVEMAVDALLKECASVNYSPEEVHKCITYMDDDLIAKAAIDLAIEFDCEISDLARELNWLEGQKWQRPATQQLSGAKAETVIDPDWSGYLGQ